MEELIDFFKENVPLLMSRGFLRNKFFMNSLNLKELIPKENLAPIRLLNCESEMLSQNTSGITWDSSSDCFKFTCSFSKHDYSKVTRGIVLLTYSRIFDPLGFIQFEFIHFCT